jgi:hypothetical protein
MDIPKDNKCRTNKMSVVLKKDFSTTCIRCYFKAAMFSILQISYIIKNWPPPLPSPSTKGLFWVCCCCISQTFLHVKGCSRQLRPLILNLQMATIIRFRHDTYLKYMDPSWMACSDEEKLLGMYSISSNRPSCRWHLRGDEGWLPEFWPLNSKTAIVCDVAQETVWCPRTIKNTYTIVADNSSIKICNDLHQEL